jgi:hypothetical protein
MTKWLDVEQAAQQLGVDVPVLRRLARSSRNPPPFVRASARSMLFDRDRLLAWQRETWRTATGEKLSVALRS